MQQINKEEIKVGDIVCYEHNEYGYVTQIDELMIKVYWFKHCITFLKPLNIEWSISYQEVIQCLNQ